MTETIEDEIRAVLASMDNQESQEQEREAQPPPEQIEDIYVLIVREREEVKEDQSKVVDSEPVKPPDKPTQPVPYLMLGIILICTIPMLASIMLQVYLLQNPPIATVAVVPKSQTVTFNGTLQLGRVLNPITISQSATTPTTGRGHQDARSATGELTFYNGSNRAQTINAGTVYTGNDGVQVATDETITIPPNNPPVNGQATVTAHALIANTQGNIAADDINFALSSDLTVKNLAMFTDGQDERDFSTVSKQDMNKLSPALETEVIQSMNGALEAQAKQNETILLLPCNPNISSDKQPGAEATQVKVTVSETCSAVAYNSQELETKASALLTSKARSNLAGYSLFGDIQMKVSQASVSRTNTTTVFLSIQATGTWIYALSHTAQEQIKQHIEGKNAQEALRLLEALPGVDKGSIIFSGFTDGMRLPKNSKCIHIILLVS